VHEWEVSASVLRGGGGVLVLGLVFGLKPGSIPMDVILIIMGVIAAIAAMQEAGGLEYLVQIAEKILKSNPKYITFLAPKEETQKALPAGAKLSVLIFGVAIFCVVFYATAISKTVGLITEPILARDHAIITFMLTAAALITLFCKIDAKNILNAPTFKSGMSACICVLGVAWLGTTFVAAHMDEINVFAGNLLESKPWMLAVVLFFASMLLYSQAATTKALMPAALALGISPVAAIASFAAVSALFVLPTYPTLLAAVEFDDTGSTRIGKYVFDHPFLIPGTLTIIFAVVLGFLFGGIVL